MKHDNYYLYLLSTLLEPSYFDMILSSCIAKLVSCDFHNLLEYFKYALHISTECNTVCRSFGPFHNTDIPDAGVVVNLHVLMGARILKLKITICRFCRQIFDVRRIAVIHCMCTCENSDFSPIGSNEKTS